MYHYTRLPAPAVPGSSPIARSRPTNNGDSSSTSHLECTASPTRLFPPNIHRPSHLLESVHILQRTGQSPVIPQELEDFRDAELSWVLHLHKAADRRSDLGRRGRRRRRRLLCWILWRKRVGQVRKGLRGGGVVGGGPLADSSLSFVRKEQEKKR